MFEKKKESHKTEAPVVKAVKESAAEELARLRGVNQRMYINGERVSERVAFLKGFIAAGGK